MDNKLARFYKDLKILILGAAGTIGRELIEKLLKDNSVLEEAGRNLFGGLV
jgi:uncharacterized protein YbjT (DUF2867 family)